MIINSYGEVLMKAITKTKLICTIGPASNSESTIRKMIENGMNVADILSYIENLK